MNILIAGIGAIGSNLTRCLVADLKGEHQITVLDRDKVEERNVQASTQFYTREQLGMDKTLALQYNIYKWTGREINFLNKNILHVSQDILYNFDLITDCFDNEEARREVQSEWVEFQLFKKLHPQNLDLLHIGFSDRFTFAVEWAENYQVPTDIISGFDICELNGAAAFVNRVAAVGASVVERFVETGEKIEIVGNRFDSKQLT